MGTALLEAPAISETASDPFSVGEVDVPKGYEFVDGELREMNVSYLSSYVAGNICSSLSQHVKGIKAGWVAPEGTSFKCFRDDPDRVRRADTAFHSRGRLTRKQATTSGYLAVVPDLVVEVVSPNDSAYEVEEKYGEWLAAGAKLVWVVYPETRLVRAFRPDAPVAEFRGGETLTAAPVLPDFSVPVAELFELPEDVD